MSEASVQIELMTELSAIDAAQLKTLLAQLSTMTFDQSRIAAMLDHDATELFVARAGSQIVGMSTLVTVPLASGWRGHVEDVLVSEEMRGKGVARLLLEELTGVASQRALRTLDLTSPLARVSIEPLHVRWLRPQGHERYALHTSTDGLSSVPLRDRPCSVVLAASHAG